MKRKKNLREKYEEEMKEFEEMENNPLTRGICSGIVSNSSMKKSAGWGLALLGLTALGGFE